MKNELYAAGITQVKAYRILQAEVSSVIKAHGLGSVSEWFVLSYVSANEAVMAKDLATLLEVEAPLITRLVNNLLENKLVSISPGTNDKRAKIIKPTNKARGLAPEILADLERTLAKSLAGLTDTELATYKKVLDAIIMNGEKL